MKSPGDHGSAAGGWRARPESSSAIFPPWRPSLWGELADPKSPHHPAVHDPEGSSITTTENPSGSWEWCRWGGWFAMVTIGESEAGGAGGLAGYGEGGDRAGHAALAVREQQVPARCRLRDRDRAGEGACCGCSRVADDL